MRIVNALRTYTFIAMASAAIAGEPTWNFVHVSALANEASIERGTATIEFKRDLFSAHLQVDGVEWAVLSGTIRNKRITAKYTVLGSDYTINSPYTGTLTRKTWQGDSNSRGRVCLQLSDGFNSITIFRELAP